MMKPFLLPFLLLAGGSAMADGTNRAVSSPADAARQASFDILAAEVAIDGNRASFRMALVGAAGSAELQPAGALAGAPVHAYVWPTSLDPAAVGFDAGTGILALAATRHPDFDDTPQQDETGDGAADNDGGQWHSHWVVLSPTPACGDGALAVRDIPAGETPALPDTWPGLPLFIDSPGMVPQLSDTAITITLDLPHGADWSGTAYDGVTAALRVNADLHAPLLCVTDLFDVASGDLSLPGRM